MRLLLLDHGTEQAPQCPPRHHSRWQVADTQTRTTWCFTSTEIVGSAVVLDQAEALGTSGRPSSYTGCAPMSADHGGPSTCDQLYTWPIPRHTKRHFGLPHGGICSHVPGWCQCNRAIKRVLWEPKSQRRSESDQCRPQHNISPQVHQQSLPWTYHRRAFCQCASRSRQWQQSLQILQLLISRKFALLYQTIVESTTADIWTLWCCVWPSQTTISRKVEKSKGRSVKHHPVVQFTGMLAIPILFYSQYQNYSIRNTNIILFAIPIASSFHSSYPQNLGCFEQNIGRWRIARTTHSTISSRAPHRQTRLDQEHTRVPTRAREHKRRWRRETFRTNQSRAQPAP